MTVDVVNGQNEKVGSLDLRDEVFGGRVKADLIWHAVVHEQAARRRGTHATKTRGSSAAADASRAAEGHGPRARGRDPEPAVAQGGTVFGPQPRDYGFALPKKVERGALREALAAKLRAAR